jgi:hypothetical protein
MPSPEAKLPETRERCCPACQSERILPVGHVEAADGGIRVGASVRGLRHRVLVRAQAPRLSARSYIVPFPDPWAWEGGTPSWR